MEDGRAGQRPRGLGLPELPPQGDRAGDEQRSHQGVHDGDERVGARRSSTVPTRERLARGATVNDATDRPNEGSIRRASIRAWTTAGSRRGVESLCNYTVPDET